MHTIHILLVEDNEGDIILIKEALKEGKIKNSLSVVHDGHEAISYLQQKEKYRDELKPDLILLDLNLPKLDGIEVLSHIKSDPVLRLIPVIILTTSSRDNDILKAYSNYANCYITKPVNFTQFMEVILTIEEFWVNIVKLPKV
jgi:CheY-like chemotaxis protein